MPFHPTARFRVRLSRILLLLGFLVAVSCALSGQDTTATTLDTVPVQYRTPTFFNFRHTAPNPKIALRLSLLFPGSGQIYNGRWWKAPLAYGAVGGMVYIIDFNQSRYRRLKTAVELQLQNLPHEFSGQNTSVESLRNLRNQYDKQTQLSYIGSAVVYVIIAVESFVDAHLQNFDVSEDLSWKIKPTVIQGPGQTPQPAIGLAFCF